MHNYKELKVWNKAVDLATDVYSLTKLFPSDERFGLISQMQRSAVSISSNIAEGAGRGTASQFAHFLAVAYGSCFELATQLTIAKNLNFTDKDNFQMIDDKISEVQKMIYRLKETVDSKV
ncbi:four helix bundle protein [Fulvivirga lutimaris]|uniref:four helix bundle protein n=1 Tax=Fulvivirga lutimaris TaxID=1819566 RepID=UPI0012BB9A96|nr:four helix bundle protein [Fulvivirga lutimaris]MTI41053.1 four helix bundle protein [Fulvivirga lutimaris]